MSVFTGTKTQEDIKKNEENKKKKIEEKKNNTAPKTKSGWEKFLEGGRVDENDPNLIMSSGSGASIMEGDTRKKEEPKKEESLVANQFGDKKDKTWNDVKSENGNNPENIANWLNNNPDYKAGELTKKGMAEFGYTMDENGKWVKDDSTTNDKDDSTTNDKVLDKLDDITVGNAAAKALVDKVTNPETGDVDEEKTKGAISEYEQKLVEMGAATYDENGNFVLNNVNAKGWEDWATVLSAGLSVLGLAFGIPIMPINFRKITNKDERDAKIRELQKQYMDIEAANASKVKDVESSAEAGDYYKKNKDNIDTYLEYDEKMSNYKKKSDIDTDSEKDLIDKKLQAEMLLAQAAFENEVKKMEIEHQQQKDLQTLLSQLSTESAIELLNQRQYKWVIDAAKAAKEAGLDNRAIALNLQAWAGNTATTQNLKHAEDIVDMISKTLEAGSKYVPGNGGKGD